MADVLHAAASSWVMHCMSSPVPQILARPFVIVYVAARGVAGWPVFLPQLVISCASDVMVRPTMQALDVSGLTAIDILHVSFDMAQATWGVREWRQWSHGGPHFHWQFDTPVSLLIIEGVALI